MSTDCVRSLSDKAEHALVMPRNIYVKGETDLEEHQEKKKPRRKDTPVLNSPPLIPGVSVMKSEARMVHHESEETEMKK